GRVSPLRAVCALPNCGAHGVTRPTGSWSQCMRKKQKRAFHEPSATNPPLTPPRRGTGQADRLPSLEGLRGGFMVQCMRKNEWWLSKNLPGHRIAVCLGKAALKTRALQTLARHPFTHREREGFAARVPQTFAGSGWTHGARYG